MINCIIIDDEPLARKGLREYISDVDFLHLGGEYDNALKATEMISRGDVAIAFSRYSNAKDYRVLIL